MKSASRSQARRDLPRARQTRRDSSRASAQCSVERFMELTHATDRLSDQELLPNGHLEDAVIATSLPRSTAAPSELLAGSAVLLLCTVAWFVFSYGYIEDDAFIHLEFARSVA